MTEQTGGRTGDAGLGDLLRQVVGVVLATVFSLAFVTMVGGAVLLARFAGAGLPTEFAISLVPRSVLLAVGGEVLALAIGLAALAAVLAHFQPWFRTPAAGDGKTHGLRRLTAAAWMGVAVEARPASLLCLILPGLALRPAVAACRYVVRSRALEVLQAHRDPPQADHDDGQHNTTQTRAPARSQPADPIAYPEAKRAYAASLHCRQTAPTSGSRQPKKLPLSR